MESQAVTKPNTKRALDVFLYNKYVGKLGNENGILSFTYDAGYLKHPNALTLSASLPLQPEPFGHQVTSAFFSGLLPDENVRVRLAKYLHISEQNTFRLLEEIGGECAGAVSIQPEGYTPGTVTTPDYRILNDKEADDILSALDKHPMMAGEEGIRISGAGAQNKLIIAFVDGKIAIPKGNTPSTHIIKPAIKGLEDTVYNEHFCMALAAAVGLPVPNVDIYWLGDHPYYVVERYDRKKGNDDTVTRLHQEDFCQALHIPPDAKYENDGGPNLAQCFALLDERIKSGAMAGKNKITLLKGVIFNYLIGNGDAHGKNFSLLYEGESESLAPFYDLMCTVVYSDTYKAKMAMKISGKYTFQDITIRHFEALGEMICIKKAFVRMQVQHMAQEAYTAGASIARHLNNDPKTASPIYGQIIKVIEEHYKRIVG